MSHKNDIFEKYQKFSVGLYLPTYRETYCEDLCDLKDLSGWFVNDLENGNQNLVWFYTEQC